jgi:hypothetical protein
MIIFYCGNSPQKSINILINVKLLTGRIILIKEGIVPFVILYEIKFMLFEI